eukprot:4424792-Pleurochrysis_carterae.AAC.1
MAHVAATTAQVTPADVTSAVVAGLECAGRAARQASGTTTRGGRSIQPPPRDFTSMGLEGWKRYAENIVL